MAEFVFRFTPTQIQPLKNTPVNCDVRQWKWKCAKAGVISKRRHRSYARDFNVLRDHHPDVFFG